MNVMLSLNECDTFLFIDFSLMNFVNNSPQMSLKFSLNDLKLGNLLEVNLLVIPAGFLLV